MSLQQLRFTVESPVIRLGKIPLKVFKRLYLTAHLVVETWKFKYWKKKVFKDLKFPLSFILCTTASVRGHMYNLVQHYEYLQGRLSPKRLLLSPFEQLLCIAASMMACLCSQGFPTTTKLLQESGELCSLFSRNPSKLVDVWCLELCAGTLFVLLLKFGAVLSIICGFLMVVSCWSHRLQCIVIMCFFLRLLKLHKLVVGKLDLSMGVSL